MSDNIHHLPVGIVLAGGISARLGLDKSALKLGSDPESGPDLLTRAAALLARLLPRILISGRRMDGFEYCPDKKNGLGPTAGIAAALAYTGAPCLVLSCDLPFMDEKTLSLLLDAWKSRPKGTLTTAFRQAETGIVENLVAVYEPGALPALEKHLDKGLVKISRIIPAAQSHYLPYSQNESLPFFNINYPADLEAARLLYRHCRQLLEAPW